jgi:two-component system nitrogen regulation response regulator GlnG
MTSRAAVVLVADDDRSLRSLISAALRRQGHSVLLAASADEAIRISTSPDTSIDVLLTDLSMPGGSGISLATEIRAQRPDIAVVLMSGWQVEEPVAGIPGGDVEVLQKPFELSVLAAAVERAVARRV